MIKANFTAYSSYVTDSLYQWDKNQELEINGLNLDVAPEIHFTNVIMDKAIVRQSTLEDGSVIVDIPNSLLQQAYTIRAYIGVYEDDTFKTIEVIDIPIIAREKPSDYTISDTDEEIYSFNKLENDINNAIIRIENGVNARVNNIIANASNTGDNAELIDIRTGANNVVYASAGEAAREQISLIANMNCEILFDPNKVTLNKYIDASTGELGAGPGNFVSDFIPLRLDTNYAVTGSLITKRVYLYDENKSFIAYPSFTGNTFNISAEDYPLAKYFRVWGSKSSDVNSVMLVYGTNLPAEYTKYARKEINPTKDFVNEIISPYYSTFEIEGNGYIDTNGVIKDSSASGYRYTPLIPFLTTNIVTTATTNNTSAIAFYNEDEECIGVILGGSTLATNANIETFYLNESTIPEGIVFDDIKYLRITTLATLIDKSKYGYETKSETIVALAKETNDLRNQIEKLAVEKEISGISINLLGSFDKIVCCGDSLTWGSVNRATRDDEPVNYARKPSASYPECLAKLTGTETKTLANPGDDAEWWFNRYVVCNLNNSPTEDQIALENADITSSEESRNHPLFIVYLGTNGGLDIPENFKSNYEGVEQLRAFLPEGVGADNSRFNLNGLEMNGHYSGFDTLSENYSTYKSTIYYAKILQHLKYYGFTAVLVKPVVTIPLTDTELKAQTGTIIDYFSEIYGYPAIELPDDTQEPYYHCWPHNSGTVDAIHYNDLGYNYLASVINQKINELSTEDMLKLMPQRFYENMGFPSTN